MTLVNAAQPILPIVRICRVRTYRDRFEYLDWLKLFAAGLVECGAPAW
jgi:hypothetical protein